MSENLNVKIGDELFFSNDNGDCSIEKITDIVTPKRIGRSRNELIIETFIFCGPYQLHPNLRIRGSILIGMPEKGEIATPELRKKAERYEIISQCKSFNWKALSIEQLRVVKSVIASPDMRE